MSAFYTRFVDALANAEINWEADSFRVIRRRETYDDLLAPELDV